MNPFSQLSADEINALIDAVTPALAAIANGDGSTASLVGQGVALEGQLIASAPTVQKIAVNDLAKGALAWLAAQKKTPASAPDPTPESAPTLSPTA